MRLLTGAAIAAPAAVWAQRHFRSPAVAAWSSPTLSGRRFGPLYARKGGDGDHAVVLLHGLVSTGDVFGAGYDRIAASHRVVVPDLLGFGRSLDTSRGSFTLEAHLDALDQLADRTGLFDSRWTIGAHSMGSALALAWANRHRAHVERVVCWGAPVYASAAAARSEIAGSAMTRLFVMDTNWAKRACAVSCRHRAASGWLAALCEPSLPVPVARTMSLHTWSAYRDAVSHLVIDTDWAELLAELDHNGTHVALVWGTHDRVGDDRHAQALASRCRRATVTIVEGADHHLPMSHPAICIDQLTASDDRSTD